MVPYGSPAALKIAASPEKRKSIDFVFGTGITLTLRRNFDPGLKRENRVTNKNKKKLYKRAPLIEAVHNRNNA